MDDRRNRAWTTPLPVWARHGVVAALCDPRSRTAIAIPNEPRQKPIPADRSRSRLRSPTGSPIRRSSERRCGRLSTQPSKPLCCHRRQGRNRDRRSKSKSRAAEIVVRELISYPCPRTPRRGPLGRNVGDHGKSRIGTISSRDAMLCRDPGAAPSVIETVSSESVFSGFPSGKISEMFAAL